MIKYGNTVDTTFARKLERIELKHFVACISYNNLIISKTDKE